ncbi:ribosomal subunit 39S-domain-containing protein [Xylariales sp. AK1849]|nr:ribosomal subunit 39S-domain-containing protein [Xylariales sp. AK1849]
MRRIACLRKPSGLRCTAQRRSIASLTAQCAATTAPLSTASTPTTRTSVGCLRFYSQTPRESLPASLSDTTVERTPAEAEQPAADLAQLHESSLETLRLEDLQSAFRLPTKRQQAERPDAVSDPSYVAATVAGGLDSVGGLERWWDSREHWDPSGNFEGFKAKKKIEHPDILEVVVIRAVAEASVLKMSKREAYLVATWPIGGKEEFERCIRLDVNVDSKGAATFTGSTEAVAMDLIRGDDAAEVVEEQTITSNDTDLAASGVIEAGAGVEPVELVPQAPYPIHMPSTLEAAAIKEKWDSSWRRISLADPRVKFAVTKRVFQLTGQLIPDHRLSDITNVSALLAILKRPAKPKTLTQEVQKNRQELVGLPNVAFAPKRVTRGDKARALGQYKLVEAELAKRDLQGGHRSVPGSREKHWFKGEA